MIKAGCTDEASQIQDTFAQQCITTGCSVKQCDLVRGTDICLIKSPDCANHYFMCIADVSEDHCACTKELVDCQMSIGCALADHIEQADGFNAFELCAAEGCTAADCGLLGVCNSTALLCSDHYLDCASGRGADVGFNAEDVAARQAVVSPVVSADMRSVTWAAPVPLGGAAIAWRGVHTGKYYWEVSVPGKCAVVGVGTPNVSKFTHPGYDQHSWSYGQSPFGYGGELFNGEGIPFGASISRPSVIGIALDASKGQVWFSKDGSWLEGGDPEEGLNPAVTVSDDFEYMLPIIGVLPGCSVAVEIRANFGPDFVWDLPASFNPLKADECTCTSDYVACMDNHGVRARQSRTRTKLASYTHTSCTNSFARFGSYPCIHVL